MCQAEEDPASRRGGQGLLCADPERYGVSQGTSWHTTQPVMGGGECCEGLHVTCGTDCVVTV